MFCTSLLTRAPWRPALCGAATRQSMPGCSGIRETVIQKIKIQDVKDSRHVQMPIYAVFHEELNHNLVFHKSPKSQRWWLEVPYPPLKDFKFERHNLVPCDYEDYLTAQKGLIPDLWWKTYRKLN